MTNTDVASPATDYRIDADRRIGAAVALLGGVTLLASFLVVPGPDVADVHQAGWVPGHALSAVGFGLLALGFPSLFASFGRRLGSLGVLGYLAVMARFVLSTGSHLYSLWILPALATHPELHESLTTDGPLASIYAGHGQLFNEVLGVGMAALAVAVIRLGHGFRTMGALVGLAAVSEFAGVPFGLLLLAAVCIWLAARQMGRGSALRPLRDRETGR